MKALGRLLLILLVLLMAVGGLLYYRNRNLPVSSAAAPLSQVVAARQGNLSSNITIVGELDALQRENLTFSRMNGTAKLLRLDAKTGATVKAGQALAAIDPAPYQQALDQAKSALQAAEEKLADLKTPATKLDIAKADLAVAKTAQTLEQAKVDLAAVQSPDVLSLQTAVRDAQESLALARLQQTVAEHDSLAKSERDMQYAADWHQRRTSELQALVSQGRANLEQSNLLIQEQKTLAEAQANLALIQANRQLSLQAAIAAIAKSEATLAEAQKALATAQGGGDKLALAKAQVAVQDAEVALSVARDSRTVLDAGADATVLAAAQADVDKKRLALSDAELDLAGTTLLAPFDGTVLKVNGMVGNLIGATTQVVSVADMKALQVLASVDETAIRRVAAGQTAQITFDAFAGQVFRGKVMSVPLQGALQGNVMVYEVPVSLTGTESLPLLVGMTANVQIQVGQVTNVVLVPALAVKQVNGMDTVLAPNEEADGQPVVVQVEVGLSDGVNTQIVRGLKAGDKVLVQYPASSANNNQNNRGGNILSQLLGRGGDTRLGGR